MLRSALACAWLSMALMACGALLTTAALADGRSKDPPGYADAVRQGLNELEAGNYPEAREEFLRAHGLFPSARTSRGLGMVEFELRNYAESVRRLEEALASQVKPLEGKLRSETEALLERARRYLGEVVLQVEPSSAQVRIDGRTVEPSERSSILLEVGSHALEVQASGYLTERRTIRVAGGERNQLQVSLALPPDEEPVQAGPSARSVDPAPAPARSERTPAYKKWWVWTTVIVVAGAGAATAAILLTRKSEDETRPISGSNTTGPTLFTARSF